MPQMISIFDSLLVCICLHKTKHKCILVKIRYDIIWTLHKSLIVILVSILELERCDQQRVQSYCFVKSFLQDVCMLEKRAPYFLLLTLILDHVSLMLLFSLSLSYTTTTLTIAGEMLPPCSSLSRDINVIVLNMHSCTWICLT